MKRILVILLNLVLCIQLNAQTESCSAIVNELTRQKDVLSEQEAIDYVIAHKDSFDMDDEVDRWLYNLALGTRYYPLKKYQDALICLSEVTAIFDKNIDSMDLSQFSQLLITYYWEANCEFHLGSSKEIVLQKLNRAKSIFEIASLTQTDVYNQILSDIKALESGELDFLKEIPQAFEYAMSNQHDKAIPLIEQIINNYPISHSKEELAPYYQFLGNSYIAVGRLNDAEKFYLKVLAELKQNNAEHLEVYRNICDALGVLYCQVHNYQKAKDFSGQSKWLHEKYMDFDDSYVRCLSNCALAEYNLGHNYLAKMLVDVALKYHRKGYGYTASEKMQNAIQSIHSIFGSDFNNAKFSNNADKALQLRPYILLLSNAAMIYQQAGFWDDAVKCMKESISMLEELGEQNGLAYNNIGTMYLFQSRVNESLPYFSKAVSQCTTDYEKNEVLFNYALALWLSHSTDCSKIAIQSSKFLANSIANNFSFLSQEEKYNYYNHFESYLPCLNLMLYDMDDKSQYGYIYDNILMTKGLLLRASNDVKETILQSGNEELISDYNRMITLRQKILTERDSCLRIEIADEIELLDKKLSRSATNYGAMAKFNNINWKDVQTHLTSEDMAIEFYNIPIIQRSDTVHNIVGEPRYCAVILKKDYQNPKIVPLCKESELIDLDQDSLYCTEILNRLVWQPLAEELNGVKNIYFSADRELHKIGIEYAQIEGGNRINNIYNIYRLSSTRILAEQREKAISQNTVLYGGLLYDLDSEQLIAESRSGEFHTENAHRAVDLSSLRYGVKYLPGTKKEVKDIYQQFKASTNATCDTIIGIDGTEESFKALAGKNVGIIHLATHGFYWSEEDAEERSYVNFLANMNNKMQTFEDKALLRSGLFFSGANIGLAGEELPDDVEDGVLTAKELSAMNLGNVDMVVMSACQSGLGETSGEGVFGLQRGFKLAGANTLLMSLWKVDDYATQKLMTEFYENYLSGKSKRESLLNAQKVVRETPGFEDPECWAGFILLDGLD